MSSLNISLPEQLKTYVESQVKAGDFGTPSEYVRELIRRDKERRLRQLEGELLEALHSGEIELRPEELKGRSAVELLKKKLPSRRRKKG